MTDNTETLNYMTTSDLYLFLDFDGTLVDFAATPDDITIPDDLPDLLSRLHARLDGRLSLVSGREVATLERFLPGFPGDIFGAHGAEERRDGTLSRHPLVGSAVVDRVQRQAQDAVNNIPGLTLEIKDTGAVIHYRAAPDAVDIARAAADKISADADGMELHLSKMAFEIRPSDASKASAVRQVMADLTGDIRPAVIGDDITDEEAMAAAHEHGGLCVRVGEGETCAAHRLPDPAAVRAVLYAWAGGSA